MHAETQWEAEGSKDITARALAHAERLLREYEEPKLDDTKDEELRDFIARRMRDIPPMDALNTDY